MAGGHLVIVEKGPEGYGTYAPDIPIVLAVGDPREEVKRLMREGIARHL